MQKSHETFNYFRYLRIPLFRSKKKLNVFNKQRFRNIEFRISQFVYEEDMIR